MANVSYCRSSSLIYDENGVLICTRPLTRSISVLPRNSGNFVNTLDDLALQSLLNEIEALAKEITRIGHLEPLVVTVVPRQAESSNARRCNPPNAKIMGRCCSKHYEGISENLKDFSSL